MASAWRPSRSATLLVAVLGVTGCTPPKRDPTPAPVAEAAAGAGPASSSPGTAQDAAPRTAPSVSGPPLLPAVRRAYVATVADATKRAKTPEALRKLAPMVLLMTERPSAVRRPEKRTLFVVAAGVFLYLGGDHVLDRPRPITVFRTASEPPCIGRAERSVDVATLGESEARLTYETALVVEGCTAPAATHAMMTLEGAYPAASLTSPKEVTQMAGPFPTWVSTLGAHAPKVHRFARADDLFVTAKDHVAADGGPTSLLQVGSRTSMLGEVEVARDRDYATPMLIGVEGQSLVVVSGAILWVGPDRVVRVQSTAP